MKGVFILPGYSYILRGVKIMENSKKERPTETEGLYVGLWYNDTELNKDIFLKSVDPMIWVDAKGNVV